VSLDLSGPDHWARSLEDVHHDHGLRMQSLRTHER
jgi:hypothetical protein